MSYNPKGYMIQITRKSDEDHRNYYNRRVFVLQRFLSLFFTETIHKNRSGTGQAIWAIIDSDYYQQETLVKKA
jgi:hypothetical protein